jgi:isocitrate dehydrogenase
MEHPVTESTIIYTHTDEAPALATYSFLPIIRPTPRRPGRRGDPRHLAGRAHPGAVPRVPDRGAADRRRAAELGELATTPGANIIKLPNISASVPQLKAAVAELQSQGYALPDYPDEPKTDEERDVRARYDKVKGSAVNPVLREGNSDRRAPRR